MTLHKKCMLQHPTGRHCDNKCLLPNFNSIIVDSPYSVTTAKWFAGGYVLLYVVTFEYTQLPNGLKQKIHTSQTCTK